MWELGKKFGVSFEGQEQEVIDKLIELERRDAHGNDGNNGRVNRDCS